MYFTSGVLIGINEYSSFISQCQRFPLQFYNIFEFFFHFISLDFLLFLHGL